MTVVEIEAKNFKTEVLDQKGKVFVDFYADWCGPCRMMAPVLDELAKEKTNVKICKINVDESGDLAQQYGVMSIPTFVLFEDGQVKSKIVGGRSKEELSKLLD